VERGEAGGEAGVKSSGKWRVGSGEQKLGRACLRRQAKARPYNSAPRANPFAILPAILLVSSLLGGCGYHVAGRSDALPKTIRVIAVPALGNKTTSYRIEQRLTTATVHEFLAKTSYRVVSDPANADAVLRGKVLSLEAVPLLFDTKTGRATTMLITVKCEITMAERESGKILFHSDNFLFRNEYEISTDVKSFFEEQDPALDRLAKDFAAKLVAAVTENY
jgi:outer membrane lipopolysaccharide assembly protein LptE/RlpB